MLCFTAIQFNAVNYRLTQRGTTYAIIYVNGTRGVEQCPTYPALCGSLGIVWEHHDHGVTAIFPMVSHFCLLPFCTCSFYGHFIPMAHLKHSVCIRL